MRRSFRPGVPQNDLTHQLLGQGSVICTGHAGTDAPDGDADAPHRREVHCRTAIAVEVLQTQTVTGQWSRQRLNDFAGGDRSHSQPPLALGLIQAKLHDLAGSHRCSRDESNDRCGARYRQDDSRLGCARTPAAGRDTSNPDALPEVIVRPRSIAFEKDIDTIPPRLRVSGADECAPRQTDLRRASGLTQYPKASAGPVADRGGRAAQNVITLGPKAGGGVQLPQLVEHDQGRIPHAGLEHQVLGLRTGQSLGGNQQLVDGPAHQEGDAHGDHQLDHSEASRYPPPQHAIAVSSTAERTPWTVRYPTVTRTCRRGPAGLTLHDSVSAPERTGPPLLKPVAKHRGDVLAAAARSSSIRRAACSAASVSTLPRPIMRVTIADEPVTARRPMARTATAISTSVSVRPDVERFTRTSFCSEA